MVNSRKLFSGFVRVVFFIFLFYLVYNHYWHILFANVLIFVLLFLPLVLEKQYKLVLPVGLEVIFFSFLMFTLIISQFFQGFVQITFGLTLGLVGFVMMFLFFPRKEGKVHYYWLVFLSLCVSVSFATFIEVTKYLLKTLMGYSLGFGEYSFAINNILFVSLGSFCSSFLAFVYIKFLRGKIFRRTISKFKKENSNFFIMRSSALDEAQKMIKAGEGQLIEFKSTLRVNEHSNQPDRRIENAVLKSLVSFMNTSGGFLFVGVNDKSEITGIERDQFENVDLFNRHLTNLVKERIGAEYLPFLNFDFFKFDNKTVLRISCMKSSKPVFLKNESQEEFYVRVGASSIQLSGHRLIAYVANKFSK